MITVALFVRLEALPGKEVEAEQFLRSALAMANDELDTPIWFALKFSPTTFAIFDAFHNEAGRKAHLSGSIAQALLAKAPTLFANTLKIETIDVLGLKNVIG